MRHAAATWVSSLERRRGDARAAALRCHFGRCEKLPENGIPKEESRGGFNKHSTNIPPRKPTGIFANNYNCTSLYMLYCDGPFRRRHRLLAFFGPPFCLFGPFGKNGGFLAAQPPKRSFDRPVRWYLRYLRARDVQSATLPLLYVTSGGSNLPVRQKKRPPPSARGADRKSGGFRARSAIFGIGGHFTVLRACPPRSLFRLHQNP